MRVFAAIGIMMGLLMFITPQNTIASQLPASSCAQKGCTIATSCDTTSSNSTPNTLKTIALSAVVLAASVYLFKTQRKKWYLVVGTILSTGLLVSLTIHSPNTFANAQECPSFNPNDTIGKNVFLPPGADFIPATDSLKIEQRALLNTPNTSDKRLNFKTPQQSSVN